ncbi:MAG: hypothetical protein GX307_06250 [Euryarchaeota archaeon]|nr:hypothetical protein [Euryarchaeota archaeon]
MSGEPSRQEQTLRTIIEGRKMEAYVEYRTRDMQVCWLCGTISYKKTPMKAVGSRLICIDCFRQIREVIETMDQWEAEVQLEREISKKVGEGISL